MPKLLSIKELRSRFPAIKREIEKGSSFILLHRSRPIGELLPLREAHFQDGLLEFFSDPPKRFLIRSRKSAVELVREERERRKNAA